MNGFDLRAEYGGFRLEAKASWEAPCAALFAASGSGKTTVLEAMAGLRPEAKGAVIVGGRDVSAEPARRRRVGWVPQDASLFPHLSVRGNLAFAARARGGEVPAGAIEALEIGPLLDRPVASLSGGERQRVAVARALASRPALLLLDEPLAAIDRPLRGRIVPYLARIPEATGTPMLVVTHDPHEVVALASHVVVLAAGKVAAAGHPREVLASGAALGVLEALGAENLFDVRVVGREPGVVKLVTSGGCALDMAAVAGFPEADRVAVRAEDIMLAAAPPGPVSAQNILTGAVGALEPLGEQVVVRIDAGGERWVARVTSRAVGRLGLTPGGPVTMLIKAHAVHGRGE